MNDGSLVPALVLAMDKGRPWCSWWHACWCGPGRLHTPTQENPLSGAWPTCSPSLAGTFFLVSAGSVRLVPLRLCGHTCGPGVRVNYLLKHLISARCSRPETCTCVVCLRLRRHPFYGFRKDLYRRTGRHGAGTSRINFLWGRWMPDELWAPCSQSLCLGALMRSGRSSFAPRLEHDLLGISSCSWAPS